MSKQKIYMIVSMVVLAVSIIGSVGTYAWYTWSTDNENETKIVTNLGAATVFYNAGSNITDASLKPVATKEEGIVKAITVSTDRDTTYKVSFNLYLDIITLDEGLKDVSFKYALYKDGTENPIKEGNFSQTYLDSNLVECETNSTNHIVLISDEVVTTTELKYTLYIWIDGNMDNPNTMQSQNFNFKLHADGQNAVLGETLVQKITNLYEGADKTEVTNNSITYNYATSANLMNDRLGNANVGIDSGNIRYYGANPNNYIDIGDVYTEDTEINNYDRYAYSLYAFFQIDSQDACYAFFDCSTNYSNFGFEDAATCNSEMPTMLETTFKTSTVDGICGVTTEEAGTPILYRIIGLFQDVEIDDGSKHDLVKIIRKDSIGDFAWDLTYDANTDEVSLSNNWATSTLNSVLNDGYYNSTSSSHSYLYLPDLISGTETILTVAADFSSSGLGGSIQNKIVDVKWNLGGHNSSSVYSDQIYNYERGTTLCPNCTEKTWSGKIALMYPSDYGYATDFSKCSSNLNSYGNSGCYDNDWLNNFMTFEWLLAPRSGHSEYAFFVYGDGVVDNDGVGYGFGVRPVFYLDSGLAMVSGDGSKTNPYVVR